MLKEIDWFGTPGDTVYSDLNTCNMQKTSSIILVL